MLAAAAVAIVIDQAGYATHAPKLVMAQLARCSTPDRDSGDCVQVVDYSSITTPGDHDVEIGGVHATLHVVDDPYEPLLRLMLDGLHGQRCGTAVRVGPYAHGACHLTGAFHPSSGRSGVAPSVRGWHDAGDYGRYVVNSGIATGTLLLAAEMFGRRDIADETRWNVDWMLSMQDADGGVWHKQTSLDFAPFVRPEDDRSTSYMIGKSSCATADFAAVMAIASRVYGEPSMRAAAERAWRWVTAHPNVTFRNPPGVKTGEYDDRDCSDERLWAAAELHNDAYIAAHRAELRRAVRSDAPANWKHVGALAAWATHDPEVERRSIAAADAIVARAKKHPYRIPMTTRDYVWGSNAVAANYAMQLLIANRMQPHPEYVEAASEIVHYLLGRNTFGLSFLTGAGTHSVMHPHHRPSASDGIEAPWPGLLAGGPNRNRNDAVLRALPRGTPPARVYVDQQESYASNEVAINWNAPLMFVLAGLQKLQGDWRPLAGTVSTNFPRIDATSASTAPGGTTSP